MTPRRWVGVFCAAAAVFCFAMAGAYCSGCTQAQVATVDTDVTKALGYENLACLAANFLPGAAKADVIVICQIGEGLTSAAKAFLDGVESKRAVASIQTAGTLILAVPKDAGAQ